jgi:glycosyltransferase involved in cell wall biosynthesis
VRDGENGVVTAPEAAAIAEGIDRLFALPESRLREMGEAGRVRVQDITWDHVIDVLTQGL